MSKKKAGNRWRWIEGAVLILLILTTIMVGERLHQDALVKTAIGNVQDNALVPVTLSPGQRALKLKQKLREERLANTHKNTPAPLPVVSVTANQ